MIDLRSDEPGAAASVPAGRSPAGRRPGGLVLLANGVTALVVAQFMPWFTVSVGGGVTAALLGQNPNSTVRTYDLAALSGSAVPLYVNWALLVGLFAMAWVRPGSRLLLRVAVGLTGVSAILTFDLTRAAVQLIGRPNEYPSVELATGAWLALFGVILTGAAVVVVAAPVHVAVAHAPVPSAQPTVVTPPPGQQVTAGPVGYWSARPEWVPWWRRRGPVTALVIGAVAAVLAAGTGVWLFTHHPAPPPDVRSFLVAAPSGSTPKVYSGSQDGRFTVDQVAQSSSDPMGWSRMLRLSGVSQAAIVGWTSPDGATAMVVLMRCDSDSEAMRFLRTTNLMQERLVHSVTTSDVPGVPGAEAFVSESRDGAGRVQIQAFAQRRDIVALVIMAQPPPLDLSAINALTREQYERL